MRLIFYINLYGWLSFPLYLYHKFYKGFIAEHNQFKKKKKKPPIADHVFQKTSLKSLSNFNLYPFRETFNQMLINAPFSILVISLPLLWMGKSGKYANFHPLTPFGTKAFFLACKHITIPHDHALSPFSFTYNPVLLHLELNSMHLPPAWTTSKIFNHQEVPLIWLNF